MATQLAEVIDVGVGGVGDSFRYRFLPLFRGVAMRLETLETREVVESGPAGNILLPGPR